MTQYIFNIHKVRPAKKIVGTDINRQDPKKNGTYTKKASKTCKLKSEMNRKKNTHRIKRV